MIKQIRTDQLKPGMYIHDLNCGWLDHPFVSNTFQVRDQATVGKIIDLGIREVYIDTLKGADVWEARTQGEVNADIDRRMQAIAEKPVDKPVVADLKNEAVRARRLHGEANKLVRLVLDDIRFGQKIRRTAIPVRSAALDSPFVPLQGSPVRVNIG